MGTEAFQGLHLLLEITWRHEQLDTTLMVQFGGTTWVVQKFVRLKTHRGPSCGYNSSEKILDLFFLPLSTMMGTKKFLAAPSIQFLVHLDTGYSSFTWSHLQNSLFPVSHTLYSH